jgi:hypothetical protein
MQNDIVMEVSEVSPVCIISLNLRLFSEYSYKISHREKMDAGSSIYFAESKN